MKFYIIAGENSGDWIGGRLIHALRAQIKTYHRIAHFSDKNITDYQLSQKTKFYGIGGDCMKDAGMNVLFPMERINFMGFFELIPHLLTIRGLIRDTVEDIIEKNPHVLITIDAPGFTFRVAEQIKKIAPKSHIKLIHIVAPSVWAYNPARAQKYANVYDCLLTLFAFEPKYFSRLGLSTTCIGHPILEQQFHQASKHLRNEMKILHHAKVIAVTPGSRAGEIKRMMPVICKIFNELSVQFNIKVIFVQPNKSHIMLIASFLRDAQFDYSVSTDRLKTFATSDCALAKSGTNIIELIASGTPMIIGYKMNPITFFFLKMIVNIKYASIINIIIDQEIIPEYIQSEFNVKNIVMSLTQLISNPQYGKTQISKAQEVLKSMGFKQKSKASKVAARAIFDNI